MRAWNGWGYGIATFRALKFQILEPEIWQKSPFCGISGIFLQNSALKKKYFSESGRWPFHTPPFHTPTGRRPKNGHRGFRMKRIDDSRFYSLLWQAASQGEVGELDRRSLHAGCEVEKGTKWAMNFWVEVAPPFVRHEGETEPRGLRAFSIHSSFTSFPVADYKPNRL